MNSDDESLHKPPPIQQKPTGSFKFLKLPIFLVVILFTTTVAILGGYWLGIRTVQNTSQNTQKVSFQPNPSSHQRKVTQPSLTIAQPSPFPTSSDQTETGTATDHWKTYANSELGLSFSYPFDAKVRAEKLYSMMSSKPTDGITVEPPYSNPYSEWYSFALVVQNNPQSLDSRAIINGYIKDIRKSCSPPGCETAETILNTIKQYRNTDIDGYIFR